MTKDEALKMALEALEKSHICPLLPDDCSEAITAIKEALMSDTDGAQPESCEYCKGTGDVHSFDGEWRGVCVCKAGKALEQPEQEQLMSDQINYGMSVTQGGKRIDPMSIYKEPEQEPVAWMYEVNKAHTCLDLFEPPDDAYDEGTLHPLYTSPPQRKPLTDEEVEKMDEWLFDQPFWRVLMLVRAIEAAHGIKGEA